jgi:hypothetical protein
LLNALQDSLNRSEQILCILEFVTCQTSLDTTKSVKVRRCQVWRIWTMRCPFHRILLQIVSRVPAK